MKTKKAIETLLKSMRDEWKEIMEELNHPKLLNNYQKRLSTRIGAILWVLDRESESVAGTEK